MSSQSYSQSQMYASPTEHNAIDIEKHAAETPTGPQDPQSLKSQDGGLITAPPPQRTGLSSRLQSTIAAIESHLEARGIARVSQSDRIKLNWNAYAQIFVLWVSINLAANNIILGMIGPAAYGLGFLDSALCAVLGCLVGSLPTAWIATWGPKSGNRTFAFSRYAMGWWPNKLVVLLNIVVLLGYSMIDCVIGGQILAAVSPNGGLSVTVGIIIVAVVTWLVTTFGIQVFHYYERYAFIPQLIIYCILAGITAHKWDLSSVSEGDSATIAGNRLSFFSINLAAAITYGGISADFFVYYPPTTSAPVLFTLTTLGLTISFTFSLILGIGLASAIPSIPAYASAYNNFGAGALLTEGFSSLNGFGKFCSVLAGLGLIANAIPPAYSSGVDFQILGSWTRRVPRFLWNTFGVVVFTICALAGRTHLSDIFTNFLALMGYWVAIWFAILVEEYLFFRRIGRFSYGLGFVWKEWDEEGKLPLGIAALIAFLVGWAGAIICMAQIYYIGPVAGLVGEYGADMGNYVGFSWAATVYPPLRWMELKKFGR